MISNWGAYYTQKKVSVGSFLRNLSGHQELFEAIIAAEPKKIIEVGSGSGAMCTFLSWLGYDVLSVDNDEKVLSDAAAFTKKWNGRCRYAAADAFSLSKDIQEKDFDVAFSQGFFEHFSDEQIRQLIDEQLAVASRVIFSVPSYYYRTRDFGNERLMYVNEWASILSKYSVVSILPYHPKLRGIKSLMADLFTKPWQLFP